MLQKGSFLDPSPGHSFLASTNKSNFGLSSLSANASFNAIPGIIDNSIREDNTSTVPFFNT